MFTVPPTWLVQNSGSTIHIMLNLKLSIHSIDKIFSLKAKCHSYDKDGRQMIFLCQILVLIFESHCIVTIRI